MTKNRVYSIPYSCGKIYKGETGRPLKVRLEEHRKAVVRGEIEKSGIADHIWKEKGNHLPLWDKDEIIDRAEHWRIRRLQESAHMLGYNDLLSRPSIFLLYMNPFKNYSKNFLKNFFLKNFSTGH